MMKPRKKIIDLDSEYCGSVEASRLLGVSVPTVHKLVDTKKIDSWKTKGGHRKISRVSIKRIQLDSEIISSHQTVNSLKILAIQEDKSKKDNLELFFKNSKLDIDCMVMDNPYDALLIMSDFRPHIFLMNLCEQNAEGLGLLASIARNVKFKKMLSIVFTPSAVGEIPSRSALPLLLVVQPAPFDPVWFEGFIAAYKQRVFPVNHSKFQKKIIPTQ